VPDATARVSLGFVDIHAAFGPDPGTAAAAGTSLASLVEAREAHGIRLSLASSLLASSADGSSGNRLAAEAAADPANGLAAIAVIGPHRTGDVERRLDEAERSGAVGYRLAGWDGSAPPPAAIGEVLGAIARSGRPLLVKLERTGAASQIGAATAELGIPVVLLGAHYTHIVDDLAAAARYPHLHLETSALAHFRAIETAVRTIGAERLLLGTGSPGRAAGSPIGAILASTIAADAKRLILGGNAVRLFGLPDGPIDLPALAPPERAFDVHSHFGPLDFDVPQVLDSDLLPALRVAPNQAAVASAAVAIFGDQVRGNDQAVRAVAGSADTRGLGAYVVADPTDLPTTVQQLRRHLGAPGVLGVKVHGEWSGTPTASRAMSDLFGLLAGFGRPVKIHNAGAGWDEALGTLARRHPRLPIVIAHGGLGTPSVEGARLAAAHDNVYVEFSSSFAHLPTVRQAAAIAGPERLLWGSDGPLLDPAFVMGTYGDAGLRSEDLDRVFWTNATGLFGW
jgi:hypothetical protein